MLWAHLLFHGDNFERRMDVEHIEDCLIEQRVVIPDEFWEVSNWMQGTHGVQIPNPYGVPAEIVWENEVFTVLRKIAEVNRCRRNYLLLRDWSKKRPWS